MRDAGNVGAPDRQTRACRRHAVNDVTGPS